LNMRADKRAGRGLFLLRGADGDFLQVHSLRSSPMHCSRYRPFALLSVACAALLATCAANASSNPHEVYVDVGLFGTKGGGYAHSISDIFGVRADFSRLSSGHSLNVGQYHYDATLKGRQMGLYADWFPFGGKLHLTAGLHSRKLEADVDARFKGERTIRVGQVPVNYGGPEDWVKANLHWPSVVPYLGLGFGHSTIQRAGFGFVTEIGVSIGSPKVQLAISEPLRKKMDAATSVPDSPWGNTTTDAEVEHQRRELADDVAKIKVFPHMYIGVAYRF